MIDRGPRSLSGNGAQGRRNIVAHLSDRGEREKATWHQDFAPAYRTSGHQRARTAVTL